MFLFETERLGLRLLEPSDLDDIMTFWGDEEVMQYCGGPGTRERELRAVDYYAELQQRRGLSVYGVFEKNDKCMIGACGFNPGKQRMKRSLFTISPNHTGEKVMLQKQRGLAFLTRGAYNL